MSDLTPEQQAHVDEVVAAHSRSFRSDWGPVIAGLADGLGLTKSEAFTFLVVNHLGLTIDELRRASHVKFDPTCSHCVEQRRVQQIQTDYMEMAMQFMKDERGEDWSPAV